MGKAKDGGMTIQHAGNDLAGRSRPAGPIHPALADFMATGDVTAPAVATFMAGRTAPLAEPGALTFLWQGEAERIELLRWINAGVDRVPFDRLGDSPLWHARVPVQDGGRFEYKMNIVRGGGEDWVLDPMNPHRAGDPFGENSVAMTHGYTRPDWSMDQGAPPGDVRDIDVVSEVFGHVRREKVYLPHGYDPRARYPLVIVHDGGDYDAFADLTTSLDNLIASDVIPPVIAALIQTRDRIDEYPRGRRHARYVVGELLPALTDACAISGDSRDRVLLGASLGAVASLSTAYRYPGTFGGLILKSGSFILDRDKLTGRTHKVFHRTARLVQVMRRAPALDGVRAFISTGELEGLASDNRALAKMLRLRGIEVLFQSSWDGHHWHNWRDQLRDALIWVLGADRKP